MFNLQKAFESRSLQFLESHQFVDFNLFNVTLTTFFYMCFLLVILGRVFFTHIFHVLCIEKSSKLCIVLKHGSTHFFYLKLDQFMENKNKSLTSRTNT